MTYEPMTKNPKMSKTGKGRADNPRIPVLQWNHENDAGKTGGHDRL
jgi:hypothetical protein